MKKISIAIIMFFFAMSVGMNAQTCYVDYCAASENFGSSTNWTSSSGNASGNQTYVNTTTTRAVFDNVQCGGVNRNITRDLSTLLGTSLYNSFLSSTGNWSCAFDFVWESSSSAGPGLLIWGASDASSDPVNPNSTGGANSSSTTTSTADLIGVTLLSPLNNSSAAELSILAKDGNNSYVSASSGCYSSYLSGTLFGYGSGVAISKNVQYRVQIERYGDLIHLFVKQGTTLIGERYLVLPSGVTISNLQYLHFGNIPQGGYTRRTTGWVDALCFSAQPCAYSAFMAGSGCAGHPVTSAVQPQVSGASYVWTGYPGCTSCTTSVNSLSPTWSTAGSYSVGVTVNFPSGCSIASTGTATIAPPCTSYQPVEGETTTTEASALTGISLYPNPATSSLVLQNTPEGSNIRIFGIQGNEVMNHTAGSGEVTLNVLSLPAGMYMVQVRQPDGQVESLHFQKQ